MASGDLLVPSMAVKWCLSSKKTFDANHCLPVKNDVEWLNVFETCL